MTQDNIKVLDCIPDIEQYIVENKHNLTDININSKKKAKFKCKTCNTTFESTFKSYISNRGMCEDCNSFSHDLLKDMKSQTLGIWFRGISHIPNTNGGTNIIVSDYNLPMCNVDMNTVSINSKEKLQFMCNHGHKFMESPYNITHHGKWCPICSHSRLISLPELYIYYFLIDDFKDIEQQRHCEFNARKTYDLYIPSRKVAIEFDGEHWHKDLEKDLEKDKLAKAEGVTLLRIKEAHIDGNVKRIYAFIDEHKDTISNNWFILNKAVNSVESMMSALDWLQHKLNKITRKLPDDIKHQMLADIFLGVKANNLLQHIAIGSTQDEYDYIHNSIRPESISIYEDTFKINMICHKCGQIYSITPYDLICKRIGHGCNKMTQLIK
ncbi:MAG: zinc-ribbon domain-containing protein [Lachnospiraceae bacterium]|nr:zinc-ribbon domain-containing protein [Lachnospiraceae bacterium]